MLKEHLIFLIIACLFSANSLAAEYQRLSKSMPHKKMQKITPPEEGWQVLPSSREKQLGWITFQRPMVEPIFPGTKPRPKEQLTFLRGFAARDEFETLTLSIYPLHELKDLKITISDLKMGSRQIKASDIQVRLATYRYILYPRYVSRNSCMRMPEFLEPVTANNAPKTEAQRYYITIKTPANAAAGLYHGTVKIQCGKQEQRLAVSFRVMPFKLLQDPNKNYSVMYGSGSPLLELGKGKGQKWIEHALRSDFKNMRNYGLNTLPSFWLTYNPKTVSWDFSPKVIKAINMARKVGLRKPLMIVGSPFGKLYKEAVGKRITSHCVPPEPVPESVYEKFDKIVGKLAKQAKKENYPEMIFCPLDEISAEQDSMELGKRVYEIFKKYGFKTYATKDSKSSKASILAPYVDYWCSQSFSKAYKDIVSDKTHGYWSYPNLNTYELKNPLIMCKGGRMTFGFGFWRSGYSMIYPYIWRSARKNHLANASAGGNFFDDNGNVIMTTYWECFREGIDDAKYVYTLQHAIVQREGSNNQKLRKLVKKGKELLQDIWDSILVQPQYLDKKMWASAEFNLRRWQIAEMIAKLYKFQPVNKRIAPSVIVDAKKQAKATPDLTSQVIGKMGKSSIEKIVLADKDFSQWQPGWEKVVGSVQKDSNGIIQIKMKMDSSNGIGWPRITRSFKNGGIDISGYDFFSIYVKIDSNRDEVQDDTTPLSLLIYGKNKSSSFARILTEAEQGKWLHILFPLNSILQKLPIKEQQHIVRMLICVREGDYPDGTELVLQFKNLEFLKIKKALIAETEIPKIIYSGSGNMKYKLKILGASAKNICKLRTVLLDADGKVKASMSDDIMSSNFTMLDLPLQKIKAGIYTFKVEIHDVENKLISVYQQYIKTVNSPYKEK